MDYYVVGDIHGMADLALQADKLVRKILAEEPQSHAIFLGNYIDQGGEEFETLRILDQLRIDFPDRCHFVIGSHELLMLNTLYYAKRKNSTFNKCFHFWWQSNAFTTLWSSPSGEHLSWDTPVFVGVIKEFLPFFKQLVGKIQIQTDKEGVHEEVRGFELTHTGSCGNRIKHCKKKKYMKCKCMEPRITRVFGHTTTSENAIKTQINSEAFRPLDAGSFLSRKLVFASLLKPKVEILTTKKYSAFYDEQYRWLKESKEKYVQTKNLLEKKAPYELENPNIICLRTKTLVPS